jgi:starch-binding outer membrane protein, SusD/RagB family
MKFKNINKKFLSLACVVFLASCDSKLDIEPRQSINAETAIENAVDLESVVKGAYSIAAGGSLYGTNLNVIPELLGNTNYCTWVGSFQGYRQLNAKNMNSLNTEASRTWIQAYNAIKNLNVALVNLDKVTDADLKNQLEGEALFLRGALYFELVRLYGLPFDATITNNQLGVPLILTPTSSVDEASVKLPRNTVAEVYTRVITDLTAASTKLPNDNGTRADKYTAFAFLSRVYLQQQNYSAALTAANTVIASGKYSLGASVTSVFGNKNTAESIFEIQQNDQNNAGTSNDGLATFYANLPGIGRADLRPLGAFINSFEATDTRRTTLFYAGQSGANPPVARPGFNANGKWTAFGQNIPVVRLSEMYLTRAECNFRLLSVVGDTPINDVNRVRQRAGATPRLLLTLDLILQERDFELCFEGLRIHDYKRTKRSASTISIGGVATALTFNDRRLVLPIPLREVQANELLVQNAGY